MDTRRALDSVLFILRYCTDVIRLGILRSEENRHGLFLYPHVSACDRPFQYVRDLPGTNDIRCPRRCTYRRQGV
jgi:hypothetical protein